LIIMIGEEEGVWSACSSIHPAPTSGSIRVLQHCGRRQCDCFGPAGV